MKNFIPFCFVLLLSLVACNSDNPNFQAEAADAEHFHATMQKISDVIVHDIFSPPVASRIYAYSSLAGYEALRGGYTDYASMDGQLSQFTGVPQPEAGKEYCYPLASVIASLKVGKALIFSEEKIEEFQQEQLATFEALNMPKEVFERSVAYGQAVGDHVLAWSAKDNYKQTRTAPKYTISEKKDLWRPTPPDYMDGIEPHWKSIRTLVIDSASQFRPTPPIPFNSAKGSPFYASAMVVYDALKENKEEKVTIAKFWDCNPYVSHHKGHVMFATKKITPGGHWIGICQTACRQTNADMMKSAEAYLLTSINLFDAFISCWEEKYRSNLVRPETYINTFIDENWFPILQTPPFPEHTSGHSVISAAASRALTRVFGDNFAYIDSVEVHYGLEPRSFKSFIAASEEAAVSRLYGGIHYEPAIYEGVKQGVAVSEYIAKKVKTSPNSLSAK